MKKILFLIFTAMIIMLSFSIHDVHAISETISDKTSCNAIGGSWIANVCSVYSLTVTSGETLIITFGASLQNTGTITNNGLIINNGNMVSNYRASITNNGIIDNNGFITNYYSTITDLGLINNNSSGVITNYSGSINMDSTGSVNNYGIINNNGNSTDNTIGTLNNSGTITNPGTINNNLDGTLTNSGTVARPSYISDISGTISNAGTIINNQGDIITINSNESGPLGTLTGFINNCGTFTNIGTITINGFSNLFNDNNSIFGLGCTTSNIGTITNSGTINNNSEIEVWYFKIIGGILNAGTFTNTGTINNNVGSQMDNGYIFNNSGNFYNHGTISNALAYQNSNTILMGLVTNSGIIVNNAGGTINNYDNVVGNPGVIINDAGGIIDNNYGSTINNGRTSGIVTARIFNNCDGIINNLGTMSGNAVIPLCKLVFVNGAGQTLDIGQVSNTIGIQQQDLSGIPINTLGTGMITRLVTTSSTGQFSATQSPFHAIPCQSCFVTILAGHSGFPFYYTDTSSGNPTITASIPYYVSASTTFVINTPVQSIQDIINQISNMDVLKGLKNSLDAKLNAIISKLNSNACIQGKGLLNAFINEVNAQIGKTISQLDAKKLISKATDIEKSLHC